MFPAPSPLLLTPGPVAIPQWVYEAMRQPVIPHRTAAFEAFYAILLADLRYYFQTKSVVGTMIASGTGAVSAAMYSLFRPGEQVMVVNNGKFSQRWTAEAQRLGLELLEVKKAWGEAPTAEELCALAAQQPDLRGVMLTHCETSTGACLDLEEIAFALKAQSPELLIVADSITTAGAIPFYLDAWQIDAAIASSQKALMNPAGVGCFALSAAACGRLRATHPGDYMNLYNYVQSAQLSNYPFTPPLSLLYGLAAALAYVRAEGLPAVWNRSHRAAQRFRKGVERLGGDLFPRQPSDSLSVFSLPGRDMEKLRQALEQRQLILAEGQDSLRGKVLRVSHMGLADEKAMQELLEVMQEVVG